MKGTGGNSPDHGTPTRRAGRGFVRGVLLPAVAVAAVLGAGRILEIPHPAHAQDDVSEKRAPRPSTRGLADRYVDRVIDGQKVSCMYGNVYIDRDTLKAESDTAFYYREREYYQFVGNVRLTRFGAVLTCDRAHYDRFLGTGDFFGNVRLEEEGTIGTSRRGETRDNGRILRLMGDALLVTPDYSVRGDTIAQDRESGDGEAFGHVRIMEPGAKNLVTGDHANFSSADNTAEVDANPVLTSREQKGGPLTSTAGLMRFYREEDRVVMVDSVRIDQGQTKARADTAVAFGQEHLVLTGDPEVAMAASSVMKGDRIEFFYLEGQLREVLVMGNGRMEDTAPDSLAAVYEGLPDLDILEGDTITVEMEDSKITRTVVVGNARSRFTPQDLTDEVATNDVSGDTIIINFRDQEVKRVKVMGNAVGTYRFAKIAAMREMLGRSKRLADQLARSGEDSVAAADTLASLGATPAQMAAADSLLTAALDSLAAAGFDTSGSGLNFLANAEQVDYSGGEVAFEMLDRTMEIQDEGSLQFGSMKLTADHIKMDTDERELYAEGEPLVEDADSIVGERMGYNFKHKTAAVETGVTTMDNYYYKGDSIRRFPDQTMKICGGRMTSCDLEGPHYHFWSDNMKMKPGDKVVAAPVVLRIGHVPVFALPFYYKSLKSGRQSGILFPSFDFGWSSREGRYIRDFGYYWATNDYMDFLVEGDYNERQDFGFRIQNRYVKRYAFNGGLDYSHKEGLGEGRTTREWQFRWNHNQPTMFDDYKFRADVKMASTKLTSNDLAGSNNRDIVSGQMNSTVYISRNWSFMSANLSAKRDERVNAEDPTDPGSDNQLYSMTLPSLSLNFKQLTLGPSLRSGQKGSFIGNALRNTYFSQGYSFQSSETGRELTDTRDYQANGNWSLSLRPPRVAIFNVSFSASAAQRWQRHEMAGRIWGPDTNLAAGGAYRDTSYTEEETSPSLSFGTSLGTTLYGLFPMNVGRFRAVRHTARFNSSWNVRPGLRNRQDYGSSIGLGFDNRFDLKYVSQENDTTFTEKKLDGVIDWSLNTSYNPQGASGERWNDISSGLTVKPGQSRYLKLKVSNSIDPYSLALKSTRFTYGLSFAGKLDVGDVAEMEEQKRNSAIDRLGVDLQAAADSLQAEDRYGEYDEDGNFIDTSEQEELFDGEESSFYDFYNRPGRQEGPDEKDPTEGGRYIPFDVNASMSYSYTNETRTKRATGNLSLNTSLTRKWQFRYQASFDLAAGMPTRQQYSLHRDLHCWKIEFTRTISSLDSQFGFRIYLKSIPSLKFARGREDYMGSVGGAIGGGVF
ncbi:MAG: putative LPS assembly protein LptD [Candidatus Krumholzibacteriota bacterium]